MSHEKTISDLRDQLFDTLAKLKTGKIKAEDAKTISEISQVIINTAKVEVEYIKATGSDGSGFFHSRPGEIDVTPAKALGPHNVFNNRLGG